MADNGGQEGEIPVIFPDRIKIKNNTGLSPIPDGYKRIPTPDDSGFFLFEKITSPSNTANDEDYARGLKVNTFEQKEQQAQAQERPELWMENPFEGINFSVPRSEGKKLSKPTISIKSIQSENDVVTISFTYPRENEIQQISDTELQTLEPDIKANESISLLYRDKYGGLGSLRPTQHTDCKFKGFTQEGNLLFESNGNEVEFSSKKYIQGDLVISVYQKDLYIGN